MSKKKYMVTLRRGKEVKCITTESLSEIQGKYCYNGWKCVNYSEIYY